MALTSVKKILSEASLVSPEQFMDCSKVSPPRSTVPAEAQKTKSGVWVPA
jgi:hypothetical protein